MAGKKLTPEQYRKLMGDDDSRNTGAALMYYDAHGNEIGNPKAKPSAEEIRAQSAARTEELRRADPKGWARIDAAKAEEAGHRVDSILLRERLLTEAWENGDISDEDVNIARFAIFRELRHESPEAFGELVTQLNDQDIDMLDDDEEPPPHSQLAGSQLLAAIKQAEAYDSLVSSATMAQGILASESDKYVKAIGPLVNVDDQESVGTYLETKQWIAESTGINVDDLVRDAKADEAVRLVESAYAQKAAMRRDEVVEEFKRDAIVNVPTADVAEGLSYGDPTASAANEEMVEALREANMLKRAELGLSITEVPFDPEWEAPQSREEQEDPPQTVGEFRKSVLETDDKSVEHGFTIGDDDTPVTLDKAMRSVKTDDVAGGVPGVHPRH